MEIKYPFNNLLTVLTIKSKCQKLIENAHHHLPDLKPDVLNSSSKPTFYLVSNYRRQTKAARPLILEAGTSECYIKTTELACKQINLPVN